MFTNFRIQTSAVSFGSIVFSLLVGICFAASPQAAYAKQSGQLPKQNYYINFGRNAPYYLADYGDAYKNFSRGYKTAYQFGNRRHLDSICHLTMMGECNYHMGKYAEAVALYEQALSLYLSYQAEGWQFRLQLPGTVPPNNTAFNQSQVNWGQPKRTTVIARVPSTIGMMFGRLDSERALQDGGVVQNAEIYKVDVVEIMRCTALCLHRRRVIKGPIAKYDPFTDQLISGLSVAGTGNGTIMGAYNGVLLGIAQASMEDWNKASGTLKSSLLMNRMNHSLTPIALLELAQIGAVTENYGIATELAMEASYCAGMFGQHDLVEESLGVATTVHLMTSKTPFPPLQNAIAWAQRRDARMAQASLIVKLAECYAESGDSRTATTVLRAASKPINNRNSLANAVVSARLKYVVALTQFLDGNFRGGMSSLVASIKHFQNGSLWLYQLRLADQLVISNKITERKADLLYGSLLRDPTDKDWKTDPMEAITFLATPHVGSMELWFDILVSRLNHARALEVGDLVRRHRFFSYLPLGGRLMAFRWVMHAPEEALSRNAKEQRTSFLNSNAVYRKLYDRGNQINTQLRALPLKPDSRSPEERQQLALLEELAKISDTQEAILASFALRRAPAEMAFPPQLQASEFRSSLSDKQLAIVSLATSRGYHIYLMTKGATQYVGLSDGRQVLRNVAGLLKKSGITDPALDVKTLQDQEWKTTAREIKEKMFGSASDENWSKFDELVVVPDGVLWYLPFEMLPVGEGDEEKFLSDIVNIRYSPTLFLAFGVQRSLNPIKRTAVVTARMHSRGDGELSKTEFAALAPNLPDAKQYDKPIKVPSNVLGSIVDQLVVWSEIKSTKNKPLLMQPMQIDQGKIGTTIDSWMSLPWAGPENIVMPGFHSDAGTGMRGKLNGNDIFLTSMGLMASGSKTALISRWATGGKTSLKLTGQYATELDKLGPAKAILGARQMARELDVDYENEPRLRTKKSDPPLKAEHPFFWASHMLFSIPDDRPVVPDEAVDDKAVDPDAPDAGNPDAIPPVVGVPDGAMPADGVPDAAAKPVDVLNPVPAKPADATKPAAMPAGEGGTKPTGIKPTVPKTELPKVEPKTENEKPRVKFGSGKPKTGKGK